LVVDLSASFVGLPSNRIDAAIQEALFRVGEALEVEHTAFYQSKADGLAVAHSWPAERFEASSDAQHPDHLAQLARGLRRKRVLVISQFETTPDTTCAQDFLVRIGLKSAVFIGVMTSGSLLGTLMLGSLREEISWSGELEQPLQTLGAVFAGSLARKQAEGALIEGDKLSRDMLDSLESHTVVVDKGGWVVAVSEGRGFGAKMLPTVVSLGDNYFDACRDACDRGFEPARAVMAGVEAVVRGSRQMIEIECEWMSPFCRKFLKVSITPLRELGAGAVISYTDTSKHKMAESRLRQLSGKIINAVEEERKRIARDLHDDLSQRLALMGLEVAQVIHTLPSNCGDAQRRLSDAWKRNQETSIEVRRLSHHLHPSKLEYLGLVAAVKSFCKDLSEHQEMRIQFRHFDVPPSIPKAAALCIYRVVQESLRNVVKHSGAKKAQVVISCSAGEINLCISDEGAGFDPDSDKTKTGIGLIGMRERLLQIGGEISIDSRPSRGTRITARIPLKQPAQDTDVSQVTKRTES
jgi:signal transduction histidine kinase